MLQQAPLTKATATSTLGEGPVFFPIPSVVPRGREATSTIHQYLSLLTGYAFCLAHTTCSPWSPTHSLFNGDTDWQIPFGAYQRRRLQLDS